MDLQGKDFCEYISESEIKQIILSIANKINKEYKGKSVKIICVLNGAFIFTADLIRELHFDNNISFVKLSSYVGTQSSGYINEELFPKDNL